MPDLMAVSDEGDSGMGSLVESSKDVTPEKPKQSSPKLGEDSDDEDFEDETFVERLCGLTEMFPEKLVSKVKSFVGGTQTAISECYKLSRTVTWVVFSSAVVLIAPVILEVERAQLEEAQRSQQKEVLLGPSAAMAKGMGRGMTMMPPR